MDDLTREEQNAVRCLQRLAKRWPKSLWIYVGDGSFCVMRRAPEGELDHNSQGSVRQDLVVAKMPIPADGGGW